MAQAKKVPEEIKAEETKEEAKKADESYVVLDPETGKYIPIRKASDKEQKRFEKKQRWSKRLGKAKKVAKIAAGAVVGTAAMIGTNVLTSVLTTKACARFTVPYQQVNLLGGATTQVKAEEVTETQPTVLVVEPEVVQE